MVLRRSISVRLAKKPAAKAQSVKKRPSAASSPARCMSGTACQPSGRLTSKRCLMILKRLQTSIPSGDREIKALMKQASKAASSRRKAEQEKAGGLLGRVIARVATVLEAEVRKTKTEADKVHEEHRSSASSKSCTERNLSAAKQAVLDSKAQLKEVEKQISAETKAIASAKTEQKDAASEVKLVDEKKRQLMDAEEKAFRPLKTAELQGGATKKTINSLCKAGEKVGFHKELLSVMPVVLRKSLERRHTFDKTVVQSLDAAFAKHLQALSSELRASEDALCECAGALAQREENLSLAKEKRQATVTAIASAEAAVSDSQKALTLAKKRVRSLPKVLKQASLRAKQSQTRNEKFRRGALAAYLKLQPVRHVAVEDFDTEQDEEEDDAMENETEELAQEEENEAEDEEEEEEEDGENEDEEAFDEETDNRKNVKGR